MSVLNTLAQTSFEYSVGGDVEISPIFVLIYLAVVVLMVFAYWKVFTKAGKPGWAVLVPIYSTIVLFNIAGRPTWWLLLLFLPFVNFVVAIIVLNDLSKSFGKGTGFTVLLLLLPFIAIPMLAWGSAEYKGPSAGDGGDSAEPPSTKIPESPVPIV